MDDETRKALVAFGVLLQSYEKILNAQSQVIAQMVASLVRIEKKLGTDPESFKVDPEDFDTASRPDLK